MVLVLSDCVFVCLYVFLSVCLSVCVSSLLMKNCCNMHCRAPWSCPFIRNFCFFVPILVYFRIFCYVALRVLCFVSSTFIFIVSEITQSELIKLICGGCDISIVVMCGAANSSLSLRHLLRLHHSAVHQGTHLSVHTHYIRTGVQLHTSLYIFTMYRCAATHLAVHIQYLQVCTTDVNRTQKF